MLEKNMKLSSLVRLMASLCLIVGLSAATGCVGGGGGGGNNGNNGNDCDSGEVFVDQLGECKVECDSGAECNTGESCTSVSAQNTSVCIGTSTEDTGGNDTTTDDTGTDDTGGGDDTGGTCGADEIEVAGACLTTCSGAGDCGDSEVCETVTQDGDMACLYSVGTLAEACTGDGDCNGPDPKFAPGGQGACIPEDTDEDGNTTFPGGFCVALPCDTQASSLLTDGCGADGICQPIDQDGNAACFALCSSNADCPRGDSADYSCNVFARQQGTNFGICFLGCSDDTDCTDQNGDQYGVCNDAGYCEQYCDPANQGGQQSCEGAGGTCVEDTESPDGGICQFG